MIYKHIPNNFMFSSREVRLSEVHLTQDLLLTDSKTLCSYRYMIQSLFAQIQSLLAQSNLDLRHEKKSSFDSDVRQ